MAHPSVPNSPESADCVRLASSLWSGAMIRLSWAHERPSQLDGSVVFEEEILETRVKSFVVRGRRNQRGGIEHGVWLEVDTDLLFMGGRIESLCVIDARSEHAVVYFHASSGLPAQETRTVKIERV